MLLQYLWWAHQLTLRRARGAASGVLGDVDSFAVSDVELKEELLLDSSLLDGLLVANCRTDRSNCDFVIRETCRGSKLGTANFF